jgi:hypothetical protein
VACGDIYVDPDGVPVASSTKIATDSGSFEDEAITICPPNRPRENSACQAVGSACEYGGSADRECNGVLVCRGAESQSYWDRQGNGRCSLNTCPKGIDMIALNGQPCALDEADGGPTTDIDEAVCNVGDGICACTTGRDGAHAHPRRWVCVRPIFSSCPAARPLAGQPCAGGLWCDYGSCQFKRGVVMECKNDVWVISGGGTPCP